VPASEARGVEAIERNARTQNRIIAICRPVARRGRQGAGATRFDEEPMPGVRVLVDDDPRAGDAAQFWESPAPDQVAC